MVLRPVPNDGATREAGFDIVHADTLRFFPELVEELGGDPELLLREVGLGALPGSDRQPHVGYRLIANLLEHAATQLQCPDFGMRLAALQGGGKVFGAIGVVMKNSSTLGEAVSYVARHSYAHSLAARVRLEPDTQGRRLFVGHEILLDRLPNKRQLIEQILLLGHLNAVEITGGRAQVREVHFRFQPLSAVRAYRRYFGCDVRFAQAEDGVIFSERDVHCPTIQPDARLYERATSYIDTHFTRVTPPLQAQLRAVILQLIGKEACTLERAAAQLLMHPRTLNRRLQEEGKSFAKVRDEVRRDMALSYLQETSLPLQRIAEKLGYAEHSVFTRSCSRWFSESPSGVRVRGAAARP